MITEEIVKIEKYINSTWPKFKTEKEVRLSNLFLVPENRGLKHIWRYGSADLVVFCNETPLCIIETGGAHHWEDKQKRNDRRKWKLAEKNGVRCLTMMNGIMDALSNRKWRTLLGKYIYGTRKK